MPGCRQVVDAGLRQAGLESPSRLVGAEDGVLPANDGQDGERQGPQHRVREYGIGRCAVDEIRHDQFEEAHEVPFFGAHLFGEQSHGQVERLAPAPSAQHEQWRHLEGEARAYARDACGGEQRQALHVGGSPDGVVERDPAALRRPHDGCPGEREAAPDVVQPACVRIGGPGRTRRGAEARLADEVYGMDTKVPGPGADVACPHGRRRRAAMEQHERRRLPRPAGQDEGFALAGRECVVPRAPAGPAAALDSARARASGRPPTGTPWTWLPLPASDTPIVPEDARFAGVTLTCAARSFVGLRAARSAVAAPKT